MATLQIWVHLLFGDRETVYRMPVVPGTLPVLEIRPMGQTKGDAIEIKKNAFGLSQEAVK